MTSNNICFLGCDFDNSNICFLGCDSDNSKVNKLYRRNKYELYSEYLVIIHIMLEHIRMIRNEDPKASLRVAKHSLIIFSKYDNFMPLLLHFKKLDINMDTKEYARELDTVVDMVVKIVCDFNKLSEFWPKDFDCDIEGTIKNMIEKVNTPGALLI